MWYLTIALAALSGCAHVGARTGNIGFEAIDAPPRGWAYVRNAWNDESIHLRVHLYEQNIERFEQIVIDVSTPNHPRYGQHLSREEVHDIIYPSTDATSMVVSILQQHNIQHVNIHPDFVEFITTVGTANDLFQTHFSWFRNEQNNDMVIRTLEYSLPSDLAKHVSFVEPTLKFPGLKPLRSLVHSSKKGTSYQLAAQERCNAKTYNSNATDSRGVPLKCNCVITPECLLKLYNVYYTADCNNTNKAAFASFLGDRATYSDLLLFQENYANHTKGQNFSVVDLIPYGKRLADYDSGSGEANLDNQYLLSVSYPTPIIEYITGGCAPVVNQTANPVYDCNNEPYLRFLDAMLALPNEELPQTLSISYGEDEQTWPRGLATKVCNKFAQLGARGVSVFAGSGDGGPGDVCRNNANTTYAFQPGFPASCPWLTSVGGTEYIDPEAAAAFSSGGFSNFFPRPSYQATAIPAYLKRLGPKQQAYYNASGRGIPDVAAQGSGFLTYDGGEDTSNMGTSDSTPTFAGMVALLNSARLSAGQKPLGFLNPLLYGAGRDALTDITTGGSRGCDEDIPFASWNATKGWDPVTGLGTLDFGKMLNITTPGACNAKGPIGTNPSGETC